MDDKYKNRIDQTRDELDYAARQSFWTGGKWIVAAVVAILLVAAGVWYATVLVAKPRGAGDAYKQNQSATNRISNQEWFEQTYQDIQAADANINVLHQTLQADPSYVNKTNYTGAVLACNNLVHDYDAAARKYTAKDWRSNDLPPAIDQTDPKFNCKEDAK